MYKIKGCTLYHQSNDNNLGVLMDCSCSGDIPNLTPADFEYHLREVLNEIMKIPKVFVNLVLVGNISGVSCI